MARRLALGVVLVVLLAASAGPGVAGEQGQSAGGRIAHLNAQVAEARRKEQTLRSQIAAVSTQIRALARRVGAVSNRLAPIERELVLREIRLNRLNALFQLQTDRLHFLRGQYQVALERLSERLVAIYESEWPDTLAVALSAKSFTDLLDGLDYARQIGSQANTVAATVATARSEVRLQLGRTTIARRNVFGETQVIAFRVRQVRELRDQLLLSRDRLASQRESHRGDLERLSRSERAEEDEIQHLRQGDIALTSRIRATQGVVDVTPSAAGLVWPVSGPITSGFGPRWGSFHYGLDIGASSGTPIHAAGAGRVIYAGWYDGFGNFVVIDHGGGLSTTYGHQSQIAVSLGETVTQGQVIGYVGSTGFSTGPHLDFEVRVNGAPVDPLGYL